MSLDFQQVRDQIAQLGERAPTRQRELQTRLQQARHQLVSNAKNISALRQKVQMVVQQHDPALRCALPVSEPLTASFPPPGLNEELAILAADGSQITPDRHAEVEYGLINVGVICMQLGSKEPPKTQIMSRLLFGEELYTRYGTITEASLALQRDLNERAILADLAKNLPPPVVTFTDGPMELWGGKEGGEAATEFQQSLQKYLEALERLQQLSIATAGYVDKPAANLIVRLLEVAMLAETEFAGIREHQPLRGVRDRDLLAEHLPPGYRSAVFAIQSQSAHNYKGPLALHFFYLNVGRAGKPALARVEVPGWVAADAELLNQLHAALVTQCQILGNRPYPYLLHRAHETAKVSLPEKEQVTQMILHELMRHGITHEEMSAKQALKETGSQRSGGYHRRRW
mgnify:CR=1 FL=1